MMAQERKPINKTQETSQATDRGLLQLLREMLGPGPLETLTSTPESRQRERDFRASMNAFTGRRLPERGDIKLPNPEEK